MKSLVDFTDKPNQRKFFFSQQPFAGFFGGINAGKTYVACAKGLLLTEAYPGNVGLVGRLTYPELRDSTRKTFLDLVKARNGGTLEEGPLVKSFNKADNELLTQDGSLVLFRHLDEPEKLLSVNLGWFFVDQGEEIPLETYLTLEGRLRLWTPNAVEEFKTKWGEILKSRNGWVGVPRHFGMVTGNPAPTWPKRKFKEDRTGRYFLVEATSEENRSNHPAGFLDHLRATYPSDWVKRFLDGSWDTFQGQIYKDFDMDGLHGVPPFDVPSHWPRFVGWDHGKVNPTAAIFKAVDEEGNVVAYKEYYKAGLTPKEHAENFKALVQGDYLPKSDNGKLLVWMDPSAKGDYGSDNRSVQQHYIDFGIYGLDADNNVDDGILVTQELLKPDPNHRFPKWHPRSGELGAPHYFVVQNACPNLVHEMQLYQYEQKRAGQEVNEKEKPRKYLDHAVDADRYANKAIRGNKAPKVDGPKPPEQRNTEFHQAQMAALAQGAFTPEEDFT